MDWDRRETSEDDFTLLHWSKNLHPLQNSANFVRVDWVQRMTPFLQELSRALQALDSPRSPTRHHNLVGTDCFLSHGNGLIILSHFMWAWKGSFWGMGGLLWLSRTGRPSPSRGCREPSRTFDYDQEICKLPTAYTIWHWVATVSLLKSETSLCGNRYAKGSFDCSSVSWTQRPGF